MDQHQIEEEIRRLSPWYYRFDLGGVSTSITTPCDPQGHRSVSLPERAVDLLAGRTVLDVGCNEGGYTFEALARGAAHVHGFDCRPVNIEKARFVADVLGYQNAEFSLGACDEWIETNSRTYDVVFLCGLLYHVPEPWKTIKAYCGIASRTMFITCVLAGGEDGYTDLQEEEHISSSKDALPSLMPNTTRTLVREFEKWGFLATQIGESRSEFFWGGCSLVLANTSHVGACRGGEHSGSESDGIEIQLVPRGPHRSPADIVLYNWRSEVRELDGYLTARDASGTPLFSHGPEPIRLTPRVWAADGSFSESVSFPAELPPVFSTLTVEILLHERGASSPICGRSFVLS